MFCNICGQLIAFATDGEDTLVHKTLVPITDHEPELCETDRERLQ